SIALLVPCLVAFVLSVSAEEPKGAQALVETQAAAGKTEEKKTPITPPKQANEILGKRVFYGGYLTDLTTAEKKRPFFSLRTPNDPEKDRENLWFAHGTDPVHGSNSGSDIRGVVVFSIRH